MEQSQEVRISFFIHLPPDTSFDPDSAWEQAKAQQKLER